MTSNWIMTEFLRELNNREMEPDECPLTPGHLGLLLKLIEQGTISGKIGKQVLAGMLETGNMPDEIVKEKGWVQIRDQKEIEDIIEQVMKENPDIVESIRGGKEKAMSFLVGQVMKKSQGKANPQLVNKILLEKIKSSS